MRIALTITELDPGGAELCLTELALYLNQQGHTVKVCSIGPRPAAGRDVLVQRLTAASIEVTFGQARKWTQWLRALRWLKAELKTFRPDIVQSMLWHANLLTASALWSERTPVVGGMRVSEPRSSRWRLERWASRRLQRMVCVSQDVYEHALHKQCIDAQKLLVIPNGISQLWLNDQAADVDWQKICKSNPSQVMLFVGRLEAQKGVLPLIEHMADVLREQQAWSLVLMGQGSLQSQLVAEIQRQQLQNHVHLAGWQPEAPKWMQAAELLLLPAEYEGMPNVLLEAMAVGRPFVAFAVDGVRQLVSDAYPATLARAQLASPGNWSEFTQLVLQQLQQPELRHNCGQANRQHVARYFRLEDQLAKYLALYESLISDKK